MTAAEIAVLCVAAFAALILAYVLRECWRQSHAAFHEDVIKEPLVKNLPSLEPYSPKRQRSFKIAAAYANKG